MQFDGDHAPARRQRATHHSGIGVTMPHQAQTDTVVGMAFDDVVLMPIAGLDDDRLPGQRAHQGAVDAALVGTLTGHEDLIEHMAVLGIGEGFLRSHPADRHQFDAHRQRPLLDAHAMHAIRRLRPRCLLRHRSRLGRLSPLRRAFACRRNLPCASSSLSHLYVVRRRQAISREPTASTGM